MIPTIAALGVLGSPAGIGERISELGQSLYAAIPHSGSGNDLLSPQSVYDCLGLLVPAASGHTLSDLLNALNYGPNDESVFLTEIQAKTSKPSAGVLEANAVWTRPGISLSSAYQTTVLQQFGASATPLVGLGAAGASQINDWVNQNTKGRILTLFDRLNGSTQVVLTNAIAFDGTWVRSFDPGRTHSLPFHAESGDQTVATMGQMASFRYADGAHGQVAVLPYKEGESMWIGLPAQGGDPSDAMSDLFAKPNLTARQLDLQLPKFTYSCSYSLNGPLKQIGFAGIFGNPDFSHMTQNSVPLNVSEVIQKTFIKVDVKGTQAAAATGAVMAMSMVGGQQPPVRFHVDHPFAFAIRDDKTGSILFMGTVRSIAAG